MISLSRLSISILSNLLKLLVVSAMMLKSDVSQSAVSSEWLAGEDNRSKWAAVGVLDKMSGDSLKKD